MNSNAGMYVGLILIAVLLFFCFPPLLYLMAILFGVVIPIQAGSLILSVRAIFKMDADFKSAYLLMSIVLFVTAVIFFIVGMMSANIIIAYFYQFIVIIAFNIIAPTVIASYNFTIITKLYFFNSIFSIK